MTKKDAIKKFGVEVVNEARTLYETDAYKVLFPEDCTLEGDCPLGDVEEVVSYLYKAERSLKKQIEKSIMVHDTDEDRADTIAYLKKTKQYNIHSTAYEMQLLHTLYWTIKDRNKDVVLK